MHLELACRDERQVPFERLGVNPSQFMNDEYRPTGISLGDPRAMKRESIIKFFQHVAQREDLHGITQAFRFHTVLTSRKNGTLIPASYKADGEDSGHESSPLPRPRRRRKAPENTGNDALLSPDASEEPNPATPTGPAQADLNTERATSAESAETPANPTRALHDQPSAHIGTGLITPVDTPGRSQNRMASSSPPVRNRGKRQKAKFVILEAEEEPPDESSLSQPRRSQRTSVKITDSANPKPKRKTKTSKKIVGE
jgi:hypothetical protein